MQFSNYFDIPVEELENMSMISYLEQLYRRINAPKGKIQAWYILPHEEKGIKRVCVYYKTEKTPKIRAGK
ncbi:MAG: hypothetical protein KAS63_06485 [Candidatus Heimdallarchaeota archaeon]|nr:hypothetical protein [Candidatus Heimdallarchaeota archaeon]MCK4954990.1 hypothetical protein [Candidatus Heimdallarchaeota archaeon]